MTNPIFVRTRHVYDSYRDFWRLVEVSGYETCYVDELNTHNRDACYIVPLINGEWAHDFGTARVIHWNMEWLDDTGVFRVPGIREVWTADKAHADHAHIRYVPVGSDTRLREKGGKPKPDPEYDIAMLSYLSPRRSNAHNHLVEAGYRLAPNVGPVHGRHDVLLNTRVVLHIHQTEVPAISPLRLAVAAAYKLPALSERCTDPGIHDCIPFGDYANMVEHVKSWFDYGDLNGRAEMLHERLCKEYTFRKCVEAAL